MTDCYTVDSDPIEIFLRSRIPLAAGGKMKTISSSLEQGLKSSGFPSPPSSPSSSDAPIMARSTKSKAKAKKENAKGGFNNHLTKSSKIKVEPALESCLREIGTGISWLKEVSEASDLYSSTQKEMEATPKLSVNGKAILRQLLNSVTIDEDVLNSSLASKPSWSFLTRDSERQDTSSSLFLKILQQISSEEGVNDETKQRSPLKASQIIKSLSSFFDSNSVSKNIPPDMDSNQIIYAALSFLSSSCTMLDSRITVGGTGTSITDPHDYFPLMPLLQESSNGTNESLKLYQGNVSNFKPPFLQHSSFLTKLSNLEALFWTSTILYPSRLRVIPRMGNASREKLLLGGLKGESEGKGSSSKKSVKKSGGGSKRKAAESQALGSDSKVKKKKTTVESPTKT